MWKRTVAAADAAFERSVGRSYGPATAAAAATADNVRATVDTMLPRQTTARGSVATIRPPRIAAPDVTSVANNGENSYVFRNTYYGYVKTYFSSRYVHRMLITSVLFLFLQNLNKCIFIIKPSRNLNPTKLLRCFKTNLTYYVESKSAIRNFS